MARGGCGGRWQASRALAGRVVAATRPSGFTAAALDVVSVAQPVCRIMCSMERGLEYSHSPRAVLWHVQRVMLAIRSSVGGHPIGLCLGYTTARHRGRTQDVGTRAFYMAWVAGVFRPPPTGRCAQPPGIFLSPRTKICAKRPGVYTAGRCDCDGRVSKNFARKIL